MRDKAEQGWREKIRQWVMRGKQLFSTSQDVYGDLLGLDIDDSVALSIVLRNPLGVPRVSRVGIAGLASKSIVDDVIQNAGEITTAVKMMIKTGHIQTKNCVIAVPGSKVIIKQIKLEKKLSDSAIETRAWQEARKAFPEIVKNLYLDFVVTEEQTEQKEKKYTLHLVMVKKEDVNSRLEAVEQGRLHVKVVDVDYYALERVYDWIAPQLSPLHVNQYVAFIDFNPHNMAFLVMHKQKSIYFNRQVYAGDALVSLVHQEFHFTITTESGQSAAGLKMPTLESAVKEPEGLSEEKKSQVVIAVRRLFQSFYSENTGKIIDHIIFTGRCALLTDLMRHLEKTLDIPITIGNPLLQLKLSEKINEKEIMRLGPAFALCCGLSMRGISQ